MVALTTALFTTALAAIGYVLQILWQRDQNCRGIAAALAGEIGAYMRLRNPAVRPAFLREIAKYDYDKRRQYLRAVPRSSEGHPVFDKVADKIGLLPAAVAEDVSAIYTAITVMRSAFSYLADIDDKDQSDFLVSLATRIEEGIPDAHHLVTRLQRISRRHWRARLRDALRRV
jgi:hypothetical protein